MKRPPRIIFACKDYPTLPSGYGVAAKHFFPRLQKEYGPENMAILAPVYIRDGLIKELDGSKVYGGLKGDWGENELPYHYQDFKADFVLRLGDWFPLRKLPELASKEQALWIDWTCIDWLQIPQGLVDAVLRFAWHVVPWTKYSYDRMEKFGLKNLTDPIPLGVETKLWKPIPRETLKPTFNSLGFNFDDPHFNVLMVLANQERKYIREQLEGLAVFNKVYPEARLRLYIHSHIEGDRNLIDDVTDLELINQTVFVDQYTLAEGGVPEEALVRAFNTADVVMDACLEGMGLSMVQAQAVGTPVIALGEGPAPEIVVYGTEVSSARVDYRQRLTKPVPDPVAVAHAVELVWQSKIYQVKSEKAVQHIKDHYDWGVIADQWFDLIERLQFEIDHYSLIIPQPSQLLLDRAKQIREFA